MAWSKRVSCEISMNEYAVYGVSQYRSMSIWRYQNWEKIQCEGTSKCNVGVTKYKI